MTSTPFVVGLSVLAAAGLALTTAAALLGARWIRRASSPFQGAAPAPSPPDDSTETSPSSPRLSVLKPLSGPDDGLEENLASFASLEGIPFELIGSVARADDPAAEAFLRVARRFPRAPFRLVIGEGHPDRIANAKVDRLVAAARYARGDVFLVSDSNVRIAPGDVARTIALLDDPAVGCVSNLFVGEGARDFGARVEALHLLTFVVPGNLLAAFGGVPCVVGKSMALPRRVHDEIGGFAAFGDVLAEDQAIGLAVRAAGYRIALSPVVVRNYVERRTLARALDRQVRWGKIRYSFSKATFASELLMNPFVLALAAFLVSAASTGSALRETGVLLAGAALLRVLQAALLDSATGGRLGPMAALLTPVKDLLQLATQAVPFVSREVAWHGRRARVGPGTRLLPSRRAPAAA
jgi:ceramide glucosyltransferase